MERWVRILAVLVALLASVAVVSASEGEAVFDAFADEYGDNGVGTVTTTPIADPLRGYNRFMFRVNDKLYFWVLKPVARGYGAVVPHPVRLAVQRAGRNLAFPVRFVNNSLQGKGRKAGDELARFSLNSTVGLLGLFDPADSVFGVRAAPEDFGQTLGRYGVGAGWPLVLPLMGPSSIRDALGGVADNLLLPLWYLEPSELAIAASVFERINMLSLRIGVYEALKAEGLDPYTFMRDAARRQREAAIKE